MPDYSFKSQLPIAQIAQLLAQKPVQEENIRMQQEQNKRDRLSSLLGALTQGAQIAGSIRSNQLAGLQQQQVKNQAAKIDQLSSVMNEPSPQAQIARTIQQYGPAQTASAGMSDMPTPTVQPTRTVTPTFGQTAAYNPETNMVSPLGGAQQQRFQSALLQADPNTVIKQMAEKMYSEKAPPTETASLVNVVLPDKSVVLGKKNKAGILTDRDGKPFPPGTILQSASTQGTFIQGGMNEKGDPVFYNNKTLEPATPNVPGGGMLYPKTPTLDQSNAGIYGERADESNTQLDTLLTKGFDPTSLQSGTLKFLPNFLQPENIQSYEQLKRNFINATLRRESGATIRQEEMSEANKQYFPQAGDSLGVLAQKKINRDTVIQGLNKIAGPMGKGTLSPKSQQNVDKVKSSGTTQVGRFIVKVN